MADHSEAVAQRREAILASQRADGEKHLAELKAELNHASAAKEAELNSKISARANHSEAVAARSAELRAERIALHQDHLRDLETKVASAARRRNELINERRKQSAASNHSDASRARQAEDVVREEQRTELERQHYLEQMEHAKRNHEALLAGRQLKAMFMSHIDHPERKEPML